MPCYTIQTAEINLENMNPDILDDAMLSLGVTDYTYLKGKLTMRTRTDIPLAKVKVAYSRAVVLSQCRKYGWKVTEKQPNVFEVVK